MDIRQIHYFLGLADELHFWRASERLHITQSALSRHIKALEDELGVRLFDRDKRNVRLTVAGLFLRGEWQRLLAEITNVHRNARLISLGEAGSIRIGHPGSVTHSLIPTLLTRLVALYPQLRVELQEIIVLKNADALLTYQVDVLLTRIAPSHNQLTCQPIASEPFALVVPDNHAVTAENFTDLRCVKDERFIIPSLQQKNQYTELLVSIFQAHGYTPTVFVESDFGSIILSLVAKGMGVSLMPISYARQAVPGVRFIELDYQSTMYMVWRTSDLNPVIQKLLQLISGE